MVTSVNQKCNEVNKRHMGELKEGILREMALSDENSRMKKELTRAVVSNTKLLERTVAL